VVILLAGLSALPASFTPSLVNFADDTQKPQELSGLSHHAMDSKINDRQIKQPLSAYTTNAHQPSAQSGQAVHAVQASLRTDSASVAPAITKCVHPLRRNAVRTRPLPVHKTTPPATLTLASNQLPQPPQEYVTIREELVVMVTQQTASGEQQSWQMHVVQVSLQPQSKPVLKPRKI
jgi:hypothetical protein